MVQLESQPVITETQSRGLVYAIEETKSNDIPCPLLVGSQAMLNILVYILKARAHNGTQVLTDFNLFLSLLPMHPNSYLHVGVSYLVAVVGAHPQQLHNPSSNQL